MNISLGSRVVAGAIAFLLWLAKVLADMSSREQEGEDTISTHLASLAAAHYPMEPGYVEPGSGGVGI